MVLADTSLWIDHFRRENPALIEWLARDLVLMHPAVMGELACGNLTRRRYTLAFLASLVPPAVATDEDVLQMIDTHRMWGRGLGWVDMHLLASALLTNCRFRTLDRKLAEAATELGLA